MHKECDQNMHEILRRWSFTISAHILCQARWKFFVATVSFYLKVIFKKTVVKARRRWALALVKKCPIDWLHKKIYSKNTLCHCSSFETIQHCFPQTFNRFQQRRKSYAIFRFFLPNRKASKLRRLLGKRADFFQALDKKFGPLFPIAKLNLLWPHAAIIGNLGYIFFNSA